MNVSEIFEDYNPGLKYVVRYSYGLLLLVNDYVFDSSKKMYTYYEGVIKRAEKKYGLSIPYLVVEASEVNREYIMDILGSDYKVVWRHLGLEDFKIVKDPKYEYYFEYRYHYRIYRKDTEDSQYIFHGEDTCVRYPNERDLLFEIIDIVGAEVFAAYISYMGVYEGNFVDDIWFGYWIRGNVIEMVGEKRAKEMYLKIRGG